MRIGPAEQIRREVARLEQEIARAKALLQKLEAEERREAARKAAGK